MQARDQPTMVEMSVGEEQGFDPLGLEGERLPIERLERS
jgi:hypothetical protein